MSIVHVSYFSDVLCIWAYATQARVDGSKRNSATWLDWNFDFVLFLAIQAARSR